MKMMLLTEQDERVLIYQNTQQIDAITGEIQNRANLLNKLIQFGMTNDEITEVAISSASIDDFIFRKHLTLNRELHKQYKAGKKNVQDDYRLPADLETLKYHLLAWLNMPTRGKNKYQYLVFDGRWIIDEQNLESHFEIQKVKLYVSGEQLHKYRKIEQLIELLKFFNVPWNHIKASPVLEKIIHATGLDITPRWQYFSNN